MSSQVYANVDVVNFCYHDNELKVILWKRDREPHINELALPGVTIKSEGEGDGIQDALDRLFNDRLTIQTSHLEQVSTTCNSYRDSRGWSLATVYLSISVWSDNLGKNLVAVNYKDIESGKIKLPFDHNSMIIGAKERLLSKSTYSSLPLMFLQKNFFTISDLLLVYKACVNDKVQEITVRKRVEFLQKTGSIRLTGEKTSGKGRPKLIYSHDGSIHYFDRSILCK